MRKCVAGLIATFLILSFSAKCQVPQRFDVIIDEILPDPTPVVSLPNAEFVEIKNTSGESINVQGWRLQSLNATSAAFPSMVLPADGFLIITSTANAALFSTYGRVLGVGSFPLLDNNGTTIWLRSKEGLTIHAVSYNTSWYKNDVKRGGGWSLEMIDTHNPCTGAGNWKASTDAKGGTPGSKNSIDGINPDKKAPAVLRAAALDSLTLQVTFDETIDSAKAAVTANYTVNEIGFAITKASAQAPAFDRVTLTLNRAIQHNTVYTVTVNNVTDCTGNAVQAVNSARFGLASPIDTFDVIINEVLFNPKPAAVDFVEIYNRSAKVLDLKDIIIANRSSTTNNLGSITPVSAENIQFFPGDFYVLSEDGLAVKNNYTAKNPGNFIDVAMPSFPDDKGTVVLLNTQGKVIDELHYDAKWHFALIDNAEGISLERVDYNKPTQLAENWYSAASTAGFATPSYQNSQFRADLSLAGELTVTPKTFSPDNDGFDDFATLHVQVSEPGFVANITIFDAVGRPVKALAKNATLAQTASFRWDGLNDRSIKVPVGTYVIFTEIFNLNGKKRSFKNTVIIAAKFK
jgi:hypothetical protein